MKCVVSDERQRFKIVFSGDLGRYGQEVMKAPAAIREADYVVVESTYGDKAHPDTPIEEQFEMLVNDTVARGGVLLIPSFAVGRTQIVLYYLRQLQEQKRIPELPVYVDSPMAIDATTTYCR